VLLLESRIDVRHAAGKSIEETPGTAGKISTRLFRPTIAGNEERQQRRHEPHETAARVRVVQRPPKTGTTAPATAHAPPEAADPSARTGQRQGQGQAPDNVVRSLKNARTAQSPNLDLLPRDGIPEGFPRRTASPVSFLRPLSLGSNRWRRRGRFQVDNVVIAKHGQRVIPAQNIVIQKRNERSRAGVLTTLTSSR